MPEALLTNLFELLALKIERGGHDIVRDWKLLKTEIKPERQTYILWAFQVILLHFFFCSNLVKYSPERKLASHTICPSCVKYLQKARSLRDVKLQRCGCPSPSCTHVPGYYHSSLAPAVPISCFLLFSQITAILSIPASRHPRTLSAFPIHMDFLSSFLEGVWIFFVSF